MIGKVISHYKILEHLGGGGMGVVYKAQDLKLDRPVALKFLPPDLTRDPEAKQRFIQEAKAASALDHQNICVVHDIGETDDGQIFIVMAFYEGATLKKKIEQGPPSLHDAVEIGLQVARGLQAAHEAGMVHRDVKPANIMLTARGEAKILDFGVAKLAGQAVLTRTGSTVGTAAYASPEQTRGEAVDRRSDIFSLGVVLYEMIAGHRPFRGEHEAAIMYSITNEPPEPLARYKADVPDELQRVIEKSLAKEPGDRYQHIDEMLVDLRKAQRNSPPAAIVKGKTRKFPLLIGGAIALVALAILGYILLLPKAAPPGDKSIAVLPFRNLSGDKEDEYFADGLTEDIITELARMRGIGKVIARTSVMQYKGIDRSVHEIGDELRVATILEGSYRRAGDRVRVVAQLIDVGNEDHLWAETYDRELTQIFEIQSSVAREIARALEVQYASGQGSESGERRTESSEAYKLYLKGRHHWNKRQAGGEDLWKAIGFFNQAIDVDPLYADAYAGLAITYAVLSGYANVPVSDTGPRLRAAARKALELDSSLAEPHAALGFFASWYAGDWAEGRLELERALELSPNDVTTNHWYSHYLTCVARFDEGIAHIKKVMEMDPVSRDLTICEGDAYYHARRYDEAIATYEKALAFDSMVSDAHRSIAYCYVAQGMYDKACDQLRRLGAPDAEPLWEAYQTGGARGYWQKRLELAFDSLGAPCVDPESVGKIYSQLGMNDRALEWLAECRRNGWPLRYLKVDPYFDNIRSDPRFTEFLKTMGLEE